MKKVFKITTAICIILVVIAYSNISIATSKKELNNKQSEINDKINSLENEIADIKEEKSEVLSAVEDLIIQISEYESEIEELGEKINYLNKQISKAEEKIKEDEKKYNQEKKALEQRLVCIYENGNTSYLDFLLSSSSLSDLISNYFLVSEIMAYDTDMLEKIEEDKKRIENEKSELENRKLELDSTKKSKQSKYEEIRKAKAKKDSYVNKLTEEEKKAKEEIEQYEADKKEIDAELKKIAQREAEEARKAAEEAAKKQNNKKPSQSNTITNANPPTPSSSGFIFPVQGLSKANIRNKTYPSYSGHTGVDVNINVTGKSVVAVKSGKVETSRALKNADGSYKSYGEYIIINHEDGTMTLYAHMLAGSRKVFEGDSVKQGQVIGTVGSTGKSTGTHLHFEVRVRSISSSGIYSYKAVNPLPYLP